MLQCMQGDGARTGAEVITLGAVGTNPTVKAVAAPNIPRTYATAVVLPTGEVAHFGGAFRAIEFSDETAVLSTGALSASALGCCEVAASATFYAQTLVR
jgi:hypothetical protein